MLAHFEHGTLMQSKVYMQTILNALWLSSHYGCITGARVATQSRITTNTQFRSWLLLAHKCLDSWTYLRALKDHSKGNTINYAAIGPRQLLGEKLRSHVLTILWNQHQIGFKKIILHVPKRKLERNRCRTRTVIFRETRRESTGDMLWRNWRSIGHQGNEKCKCSIPRQRTRETRM